MDKLATMATFCKVVRLSSFTAAGEELGLSRGMVSRHVSDLETHFGIRLLNRTTRSVSTTEAGQRYFELCTRILDEIRFGEEKISAIRNEIEGNISIIAPKWIGGFDLSQALTDFCREHPKIKINMHVGEQSVKTHDFLERGFDICIQNTHMRDSEVTVRKIGEIQYILAASGDYLAANGTPRTPQDLMQHDCLIQPSEPIWHFSDPVAASIKVPVRFSCNSFLSLCTAAVGGLGIALLPKAVAMPDLSAGILRETLPECRLENRPIYAAYAPKGSLPRKVRTLIEFLSKWYRDNPFGQARPLPFAEIYQTTRMNTLQTHMDGDKG